MRIKIKFFFNEILILLIIKNIKPNRVYIQPLRDQTERKE